jgi:hypothetical protein
MVGCLKDHPFRETLERCLNKEIDLTVEDLATVIKKDKMNVVTGEEQGIQNFESIVSCYFDTIDTRLREFYNEKMVQEVEKAKQEFIEQSAREITTDLGTLSIQEREEIYGREEFNEIIMVDGQGERKLELTKKNIDQVIKFQQAIEEKIESKRLKAMTDEKPKILPLSSDNLVVPEVTTPKNISEE